MFWPRREGAMLSNNTVHNKFVVLILNLKLMMYRFILWQHRHSTGTAQQGLNAPAAKNPC